jgi:hypothetical protein
MRRKLLFLSLFYLAALQLPAQWILDVNPSDKKNERAVQGGSQHIGIDTNTPLPQLIERLGSDWREVVTGKGYWIGYTDDMYSIAAHGEEAIDPLLSFIKNSQSTKARYGALLTLHLIGIESRIAGRFHEEFKNKRVRNSFYELLNDESLRDQVILLLVRDPWPDDLSRLFTLLGHLSDDKCKPLVNAVFRYNLTNSSFGGTLPRDSNGARVAVVEPTVITEIGELYVFTKERPDEGVDRINKLNNSDTNIVIQFQNPSGQRTVWKFRDSTEAQKRFLPYFRGHDVHEVVYDALLNDRDFVFRYCDLSDPFNFQVMGTNIYIITPAAAKARWLKWWQQHSDEVPATARRPAP